MRHFAPMIVGLLMIAGPRPHATPAPPPLTPSFRFTGIGLSRRAELRALVDRATALMADYLPARDNLFRWTGDRGHLIGKYIDLQISDSRRYALPVELDEHLGPASDGAFLVDRRGGGHRLIVVIFVDRLLENEARGAATDFARVTITLAGHLFGPAQNLLHARTDGADSRELSSLVSRDAILWARLDFLTQVMEGGAFSGLDEPTRREFTRWTTATRTECQGPLTDFGRPQ